MKYLRTDYRGVIEQLDLMPEVKQIIGLNQLPHFTTIHKFLQRFTRYRFDRLLDRTVDLFKTGPVTLAIDGTGFSSTYSSEYYKVRIKQRRTFVLSIATVDTDSKFIISQHSRKGMGENTWFRPLVSRAARLVDVTHVLGDMAYDCEVNHDFVHQTIGARSIVPVKKREGKKVHGYYRKRLYRRFPENIYHRRSLVECVFSMLKRRFGSFLQSRSLAQQNREVGLLSVVYNVYRYVSMKTCYIFWMFSTGPHVYISRLMDSIKGKGSDISARTLHVGYVWLTPFKYWWENTLHPVVQVHGLAGCHVPYLPFWHPFFHSPQRNR